MSIAQSTSNELTRAEARVAAAPSDHEAWIHWGGLLLTEERWEEAHLAMHTAVRLRPTDPRCLEGLARALYGRGEAVKSWRVLERAIEIAPDDVALRARLGHVLLRIGAIHRSVEILRAVADELPGALGIQRDLGNTLVRVGHIEEGRRRLDHVLATCPHDENALVGLGWSYEASGESEKAERIYRDIAARRPLYGHAWYRLAQLKKVSDTEKLERLLARVPSSEKEDASQFHFTLAHLYNRTGQADRAFDHALAANRTAEVDCPIDDVVERHRSARRRSITEWFVPESDRSGAQGARPIFVIGMPRSGSTLVESILMRAENTCSVGEHYGVAELMVELQYQTQGVDGETVTVRPSEMAQRYLDRLPLDPGTRERIARGEVAVVDKALGNYLSVDWIRAMFPNARFVHTVRDPRDTLLSQFFIPLHRVACAPSYDLAHLEAMYWEYVETMEHWHRSASMAIHDVHYEDMVDDHEATVRRLLEAVGLPWDPRVLDFTKREGAVMTASANQVRRGLYTQSVARWKPYAPRLAEHLSPRLMNLGERRVA